MAQNVKNAHIVPKKTLFPHFLKSVELPQNPPRLVESFHTFYFLRLPLSKQLQMIVGLMVTSNPMVALGQEVSKPVDVEC